MWSHIRSFQGPDEEATAYRFVGLPQAKKDEEEGIMVDDDKLLGYLVIHGHCPRASPCAESVEDIVELYTGPEAGINYGLH